MLDSFIIFSLLFLSCCAEETSQNFTSSSVWSPKSAQFSPNIDNRSLFHLRDLLTRTVAEVTDQIETYRKSGKIVYSGFSSRTSEDLETEKIQFTEAVKKLNQSLPEFLDQFSRYSGLSTQSDMGRQFYDPHTAAVVVGGIMLWEAFKNMPVLIKSASEHLIQTRKSLAQSVEKIVSNNRQLMDYNPQDVPKLEMDSSYQARNMNLPPLPAKYAYMRPHFVN